ncbi:ABC transporter substrate-binding protein [Comamonas serinivorans]|uniref:ABC transporter substrate-binding protein n=1 Tax=Comamonas serinivorans TaxID=1082851 RepID=A0A1Y0ESW4_9BURK|nr:tripartite tricarboxylate transporter substrate binding protein BugE [Comamonas serinivorans]ARU06676.1 ABC transporter substrate-binding protein [Comamonas serinivorans]
MQRRHCLALAVLACVSGQAFAQAAFPSKPIRLIVPFAAGGTTDIIARVMSEPMSRALGQQVVVDNKGGAGGIIGAQEAARAQPDGYTISIATVSTTAANPAINKKTGYDPIKDFVAVSNIAATPNIVVVNPKFAAKDFKSFMELIKKEPGKYSYASSGTGGIGHMQTELFKSLTGLDMQHIGYKGAGPALNDVVAGQVPIMFDNLPSALPFIKQGQLVPIVVASSERVKAIPDTPTFKEVGLEPVNRMAYYGILAPKGTPKDVVDKLHAAVVTALKDPAVRKRIEDTGSIVVGNTPEQFAKQIEAEYAIYKEVVAKQKLTLD